MSSDLAVALGIVRQAQMEAREVFKSDSYDQRAHGANEALGEVIDLILEAMVDES